MKYLLDTNICIFSLRGKYGIEEKIKKIGIRNFCISEITVFELYFGAERSANPQKSYQSIEKFIQGLEIIPIYSTVQEYAQEKNDLFKIGKPIHDEFDLLIGICAKKNNLILITENIKDFKNIRNLKVENWIER